MGRADHGTRGSQRRVTRGEGPVRQGTRAASISPGRAGQRGSLGEGSRRARRLQRRNAGSFRGQPLPPALPSPRSTQSVTVFRSGASLVWSLLLTPSSKPLSSRHTPHAFSLASLPPCLASSRLVLVRVENSSRRPHVRPQTSRCPRGEPQPVTWCPAPSRPGPPHPLAPSPALLSQRPSHSTHDRCF